MTKRVAIYACVSTDEGKQNPETQLLLRYALMPGEDCADKSVGELCHPIRPLEGNPLAHATQPSRV